jgi:DNA gyrase subunit A
MASNVDFLSDAYRNFSVYVNKNRAIPDARDGLKQGQRIALYLMRRRADKIKTIALAGQMIAEELYVHGDAAAAESISKLAAPFKNNIPLLVGQGSFGSLLRPSAYASPRYTYVKKPSYTDELLYKDADIVPMTENHDGSKLMPETFLPLVPTHLLNGAEGIGVGYSERIFPRNINDLISAIIKCAKQQKSALPVIEPSFDYMNGQRGTFKGYNKNGSMVWEFVGKVEIKDTSTLLVTELPAMNLTIEKFKEQLNDMVEANEIKEAKDHSSKTIKVEIKLRRGQARGWKEEDAIEFLKLKKESSENFVVTSFTGDGIVEYNYDKSHKYPDPIERYLREWTEWRFSQYENRYKNLIQLAEDQILYLLCVKACFDHNMPDRISKKADRSDMKKDIINCASKNRLKATDDIADRISARASYSWTKEAYKKILDEISKLENEIKEYKILLCSDSKRRDVFTAEVQALKSLKV